MSPSFISFFSSGQGVATFEQPFRALLPTRPELPTVPVLFRRAGPRVRPTPEMCRGHSELCPLLSGVSPCRSRDCSRRRKSCLFVMWCAREQTRYLGGEEGFHGVLGLLHQGVKLVDEGVESRNVTVHRARKVSQVFHRGVVKVTGKSVHVTTDGPLIMTNSPLPKGLLV